MYEEVFYVNVGGKDRSLKGTCSRCLSFIFYFLFWSNREHKDKRSCIVHMFNVVFNIAFDFIIIFLADKNIA